MAKRLLVGVVLLLALLPGCTYERTEPGLFRSPAPQVSSPAAPDPGPVASRPTNPALPVAGEEVWTTADGLDVTVRIAVHAVRRSLGSTVLDWSVTPLSAPRLRTGDPVPRSVDLGLTREAGSNVNVVLVDRDVVYRPLAHRSARVFHHCLCTPVWLVQQTLRIGQTALLQVAYPTLPPSVEFVDVGFGTVPTVFHVPVTREDQAPTAPGPTDLSRPATRASLDATYRFRYPTPPDRRQLVRVDRVVAGPDATSVAWTIESLNDQTGSRGSAFGPPVNAPVPEVRVANADPTDGLGLRPSGGGGPDLAASWMSADLYGEPGFECLCTELGLWASGLWRSGGSASVVTTFPALPAGTSRVDVVLPGVGVLTGLAVQRAVDASSRLGAPVVAAVVPWLYDVELPPRAWSTYDWPTPLPDRAQLPDYAGKVERVTALPRS